MPSSSLVDVEIEVGVKVGVEVWVEVEFEVGVEDGVEAEVKFRDQNYFFGVGGWLEKWRIKPIFQLEVEVEVGAWQQFY